MAEQSENRPLTAAELYKVNYTKMAKYLQGEAFGKKLVENAPNFLLREDGPAAYQKAVAAGVLSACQSNNKLLTECDGESLINAIVRIVRRGLTVGDNIAWLVPYKGIVEDQLGYMGLYQLAIRFGMCKQARTQPVFANDKVNIDLGTEIAVTHAPPLNGPRGELIGIYALVTLPDGTRDVEWMDKAEIERIRQLSPGRNSPAWTNHYTEQGRAKVFKRLLKRVPRPITYDPEMIRDMDDVLEGEAHEVQGRPALSAPSEQPINKLDAFVTEQRQKVPVEDLGDDIVGSQGWADHDAETGEVKQATTQRQSAQDEREPSLGLEDAPRSDRLSVGPGAPSTAKAKDEVALILPGKKAIEYHPRNVASTIVQREADGRDTKWLAAVVAANGWIIGSPLEKVLDGLRKALVDGEHD